MILSSDHNLISWYFHIAILCVCVCQACWWSTWRGGREPMWEHCWTAPNSTGLLPGDDVTCLSKWGQWFLKTVSQYFCPNFMICSFNCMCPFCSESIFSFVSGVPLFLSTFSLLHLRSNTFDQNATPPTPPLPFSLPIVQTSLSFGVPILLSKVHTNYCLYNCLWYALTVRKVSVWSQLSLVGCCRRSVAVAMAMTDSSAVWIALWTCGT